MAYYQEVILDDQGRFFSAIASADVSGGDLLKSTGVTDSVGSNADTYGIADFTVAQTDDTINCVGMALTKASSGNAVAVMMQGVVILPVGSTAPAAGEPAISAGYENMVVSGADIGSIGRTLTLGTAVTGFSIVRLNI